MQWNQLSCDDSKYSVLILHINTIHIYYILWETKIRLSDQIFIYRMVFIVVIVTTNIVATSPIIVSSHVFKSKFRLPTNCSVHIPYRIETKRRRMNKQLSEITTSMFYCKETFSLAKSYAFSLICCVSGAGVFAWQLFIIVASTYEKIHGYIFRDIAVIFFVSQICAEIINFQLQSVASVFCKQKRRIDEMRFSHFRVKINKRKMHIYIVYIQWRKECSLEIIIANE